MLLPLLAQAPPASFGEFTSNVFYVMGIIACGFAIYRYWKGSGSTTIAGQPVTIQGAPRWAPLEDHRKLEVRVLGLVDRQTYEKDRQALMDEMGRQAEQRQDLYNKVEAQSAKIAQLQSESTQQLRELGAVKSAVGALDNRIDVLPGRVIAVLKDTKGLLA